MSILRSLVHFETLNLQLTFITPVTKICDGIRLVVRSKYICCKLFSKILHIFKSSVYVVTHYISCISLGLYFDKQALSL